MSHSVGSMLLRAQRKRPPAALNLQFDNSLYMQVELVKVDMTTEQGQLDFARISLQQYQVSDQAEQ